MTTETKPNTATEMHTSGTRNEGPSITSAEGSELILQIAGQQDSAGNMTTLQALGRQANNAQITHVKSIDLAMKYLEHQVPDLIIYKINGHTDIEQDIQTIRTTTPNTTIVLATPDNPDKSGLAAAIQRMPCIIALHAATRWDEKQASAPPQREFTPVSDKANGSHPAAKKVANQIENYHLTPREKNILNLLSEGLSNKEIARKLQLSPGTVKNYVAKLFQIFDVTSRSKLLAKVTLRGQPNDSKPLSR